MRDEISELLNLVDELEAGGFETEADEVIAIASELASSFVKTAQAASPDAIQALTGQPLFQGGQLNQPNTMGLNPQQPQPQVNQNPEADAAEADRAHRMKYHEALNKLWGTVQQSQALPPNQKQAIGQLIEQAMNLLYSGGSAIATAKAEGFTKVAQMGNVPVQGGQPAQAQAEGAQPAAQPQAPAQGDSTVVSYLTQWVQTFRGDQSLNQQLRNQLVGIMTNALQAAQGQAAQQPQQQQQVKTTGDKEFDLWVQFARRKGRDEAVKHLQMDRVGYLNSGVPFVLKPKDQSYIVNVLRVAGV